MGKLAHGPRAQTFLEHSPPCLLVLLGDSGAFEDLACQSLSALSLSRPTPVRESCSCIFGVSRRCPPKL